MIWILVVAFAAAAIALFPAYQARRSFTADHARRRKQSTLDAWDTIRTRCQAELALLWEAYKDSPTLNEQDARLLHEAEGHMKQRRVALQHYLNCLERVVGSPVRSAMVAR